MFFRLIAAWFLYPKEGIISAFWKRQPFPGHRAGCREGPGQEISPRAALFLCSFPLSSLIHLGSLLIHPYTSLPLSLPVRFRPPFIPAEMGLEGFEKHFWRQPSPFVSPMASGDNNSAAAPDLLASITLQDQLIPVKITFVTEG